nr:MAG TPA: repressor domain protein [Caudoviricetes sp.]
MRNAAGNSGGECQRKVIPMTSNNVQPFEFEGNKVRALADGDEVMFVASDIAKILGYRDAAALTRTLDDEEKGTRPIDTHGGTQTMTVISEPGLYKAILQRQTGRMEVEVTREFVKRFQRWVTHEVLPSIRKHGGYMAGQERMTPEQMALAGMRWLQSKVDEQAKQLKAQEGKVLFANAVESAKTSILVGDLAKILKGNGVDIGQKRLFAWLREHGWLIKARGSSWNMPTQKSMDLGLFEIKETTVTHADGHTTINKTPKVTGKGQTYFTNLFLKPTLEATA